MLTSQTQYLCKKFGLRPHRPAGQNFLIDEKIIQDIVNAADIKSNDTVLEIGPGFGFITKELAERAGKVFAVELDKRMYEALKGLAKSYKNLKIFRKDIMTVNRDELVEDDNYKVVANLPFNITSWVLRDYLENEPIPNMLVLVVQKEIAERVIAKPGKMSILAVAVQSLAKVELIKEISNDCFWPKPKVDSAIIRLNPELIRGLDREDIKPFFRVVKAGFSNKRKKIINSLSGGLQLDKANISQILQKSGLDPALRAQDLDIQNWIDLYKNFK